MGEIIQGDCLEVMRTMAENSISAIVTDPPYGLSFMGKGWDHEVPGTEYWKGCLRVTKPGGYILAMGGSRTFHRLTSALEDSGFEIRDCLMWIYGSGFPKSHNHFGIEGYGTALKPAYEPIIMAMKPCDGTFAQNAEKWGQAGINIDGCRISTNESISNHSRGLSSSISKGIYGDSCEQSTHQTSGQKLGRWPANVMFDEEAAAMLDEQSGFSKTPISVSRNARISTGKYGDLGAATTACAGDSGGASRFFYCAKTSSKERGDGNNHPTVKPLKLMEYLIKLVMPPKDGVLLDPFAGSGSTIVAAERLGFRAIGIEKQPEYAEIARARLLNVAKRVDSAQLDLFSN